MEKGLERSSRWPSVRAAHLKQFPTCEACGAKNDLEVHHKLPYSFYPELELEPSNLMTLCGEGAHGCHLRIGHSFNFQGYNPHCVADAKQQRQRIEQRLHERKDLAA